MKKIALALVLLTTLACSKGETPEAAGNQPPASGASASLGADAERGKQLIQQYGCMTCHIVPGLDGPRGMVGPSLDAFASRPMIVNKVQNNTTNLVSYLQNPQAVDPQTAMPNLGLSEPDARAIASYLATLK